MSPKSIGAMKLQLCQTLLLSLGKSLCNPKVVWEKEQCWLTCQNSLFLFPDFFPLCGAQTHQRQDYLLMFWSRSKTIALVKSFQLASCTPWTWPWTFLDIQITYLITVIFVATSDHLSPNGALWFSRSLPYETLLKHNGQEALSASTQSTTLFQSRSFNNLWNHG